ncbi:MAG: PA2779 family protein, partial [Pseudomonadota bacterium]|nr:PA2779 family protein [Pseudomonadota bacterium]
HNRTGRKMVVWVFAASLSWLGLVGSAQSAMIGTATQLAAEQGQQARTQLEQHLASQSVQQQLVALGVDPDRVRERVAALTDAEIESLNQQIDDLPKGGVLGLIGAVFVVLLILEITGVIDIFKKT